MNPTCILKEVHLPDFARRDMQVAKGDRVYSLTAAPDELKGLGVCSLVRGFLRH